MSAPTLRARRLLGLHYARRILVLPNAWDAASARIYGEAGFPAVGTTSAGIAFSLGAPDGERVAPGEMVAAIGRIVRAVRVPVTADIEAGYGDVGRTVREVVRVGAVGINLEDSTKGRLIPITEQVDRLRQARRSAGRVPIVINARTDIYHNPKGSFEEAVERCRAYHQAGADCVFVPWVKDARTIRALVLTVGAPLNILAGPGVSSIRELERLGVARLSIGSWAMRATMGLVRRIGRELLDQGTYQDLLDGAVSYAEANGLFGR
jgi:2-methylisocitrate lyase-like PEP mutase family enzyme